MKFDIPEIFHIGDTVKVPVLGYLCRGILVSIREDDIAEVEVPCYYCVDEQSVLVEYPISKLIKAK